MLRRCAVSVVACGVVAALLVLAGPAAPAAADMPADHCGKTGPKTISGTAQGEDGRYLWAFIGIEFFDSAGRKLPGASGSGYHCHIRVNNNLLDGHGSSTSQGGKLTKNWSVGAPAGTGQIWLELYVKTNKPLGQNSQVRYGFAKREKTTVSGSGRTIHLKAPLRCGITGDGGVKGRTGEIRGQVTRQGVPVAPAPGTWMAAWNQGPDSDGYIMGWNFGTWSDDGSFVVPNLAPDQTYSVWIFEPGKADVVHWSVPVGRCGVTRHNFALSGSPPRGYIDVPPVQIVTGDFDGDGHDDVFQYGRGPLGDRIASGTDRAAQLPKTDVRVTGYYHVRAGDFDGDGHDDVFFYAPGGAADYFWWGTPTRGRFVSQRTQVNGTYDPLVGDFDGDDRDDILWYAPGGAADYLWLGRGGRGGHSDQRLTINGRYEPLVGDFGPDGRDDILWYAAGGANDYLWTSVGAAGNFSSSGFTVNGSYRPVVGDFDGDADADVVWYAPGSKPDYTWQFENNTYVSRSRPINGNYLTESADTDGDGVDDVVFRNFDQSAPDYLWFGTPAFSFISAQRDL